MSAADDGEWVEIVRRHALRESTEQERAALYADVPRWRAALSSLAKGVDGQLTRRAAECQEEQNARRADGRSGDWWAWYAEYRRWRARAVSWKNALERGFRECSAAARDCDAAKREAVAKNIAAFADAASGSSETTRNVVRDLVAAAKRLALHTDEDFTEEDRLAIAAGKAWLKAAAVEGASA